MQAAIGFTAIWRGTELQRSRAAQARQRVLDHFDEITYHQIVIGETELTFWGRGDLVQCTYTLPDGSLLLLGGSPVGNTKLEEAALELADPHSRDAFRLPWDGRVLLLHISPDGSEWTLWSDWVGSIPVYYLSTTNWRIASSLEPATVAASSFGEADLSWPAITFLLIHGHFIGDWTIFARMKTALPDSRLTLLPSGSQIDHQHSIQPLNGHFETSFDDLNEILYTLTNQTILNTLQQKETWVLPLSSGLDSRLIAAVGSQAGQDMLAYTWGPKFTRDGVHAQKIAQILGLPWQRIDLSEDYYGKYVAAWSDMFGSAMHFHGMYQMPFLDALPPQLAAPIITGFMGDPLAGSFVKYSTLDVPGNEKRFAILPDGYLHWDVASLRELLKMDPDPYLNEIVNEIERLYEGYPGASFQKNIFLNIWSRQRLFISFQSTLCDYWRGTGAPFLSREYASFWFSLPRAMLDDRKLQIAMMRRYFPRLMEIGGTYAPHPAVVHGKYFLRRKAARLIPDWISNRVWPEFSAEAFLQTDIASLQHCGEQALWPIPQVRKRLAQYFHLDKIDATYQQSLAGDIHAVRRLQSIQALALRLDTI